MIDVSSLRLKPRVAASFATALAFLAGSFFCFTGERSHSRTIIGSIAQERGYQRRGV